MPRPPAIVPPPVHPTGNAQLDFEARLARLEAMTAVLLERMTFALDDHDSILEQIFNMRIALVDAIHTQTTILGNML